jgi:hypothetical protein
MVSVQWWGWVGGCRLLGGRVGGCRNWRRVVEGTRTETGSMRLAPLPNPRTSLACRGYNPTNEGLMAGTDAFFAFPATAAGVSTANYNLPGERVRRLVGGVVRKGDRGQRHASSAWSGAWCAKSVGGRARGAPASHRRSS